MYIFNLNLVTNKVFCFKFSVCKVYSVKFSKLNVLGFNFRIDKVAGLLAEWVGYQFTNPVVPWFKSQQ